MPEVDVFELGRRQWAGEKWPLVNWIQVNTVAPYKTARTKIRAQKRTLGVEA